MPGLSSGPGTFLTHLAHLVRKGPGLRIQLASEVRFWTDPLTAQESLAGHDFYIWSHLKQRQIDLKPAATTTHLAFSPSHHSDSWVWCYYGLRCQTVCLGKTCDSHPPNNRFQPNSSRRYFYGIRRRGTCSRPVSGAAVKNARLRCATRPRRGRA